MDYDKKREWMVKTQLKSYGIDNEKVLAAFSKVPRHHFVPEDYKDSAYDNSPQPIGHKQTISQPYMVALMVQLLDVQENDRVLEIGTGSGYQTAILAEMAKEVYSIERIPILLARAEKILKILNYNNINLKVGDGSKGWLEHAGYNKIIVSAASPHVPNSLLRQLLDQGILVIPAGNEDVQDLVMVRRDGRHYIYSSHGGCRFVKLIGEEGWAR